MFQLKGSFFTKIPVLLPIGECLCGNDMKSTIVLLLFKNNLDIKEKKLLYLESLKVCWLYLGPRHLNKGARPHV
jgi:hypothetical protein